MMNIMPLQRSETNTVHPPCKNDQGEFGEIEAEPWTSRRQHQPRTWPEPK